jgi:hypothetical protein
MSMALLKKSASSSSSSASAASLAALDDHSSSAPAAAAAAAAAATAAAAADAASTSEAAVVAAAAASADAVRAAQAQARAIRDMARSSAEATAAATILESYHAEAEEHAQQEARDSVSRAFAQRFRAAAAPTPTSALSPPSPTLSLTQISASTTPSTSLIPYASRALSNSSSATAAAVAHTQPLSPSSPQRQQLLPPSQQHLKEKSHEFRRLRDEYRRCIAVVCGDLLQTPNTEFEDLLEQLHGRKPYGLSSTSPATASAPAHTPAALRRGVLASSASRGVGADGEAEDKDEDAPKVTAMKGTPRGATAVGEFKESAGTRAAKLEMEAQQRQRWENWNVWDRRTQLVRRVCESVFVRVTW